MRSRQLEKQYMNSGQTEYKPPNGDLLIPWQQINMTSAVALFLSGKGYHGWCTFVVDYPTDVRRVLALAFWLFLPQTPEVPFERKPCCELRKHTLPNSDHHLREENVVQLHTPMVQVCQEPGVVPPSFVRRYSLALYPFYCAEVVIQEAFRVVYRR
ncbi:uncharacterized protein BT62DRAFT_243108 [Guyanagaster necrorhizus]|uniref:Uncharacterized protein n=1 Tax=Guyanagaster necrorhizus TaxID=856835 RepID=A0A9P7VPR6_9AGAR|nr:uncharacterized protein BT62DRAFT_243108 [Guyanagaster necrorhizus MCA 3950]KAG7444443.1 hypothetical protein BT62DRAFT_243108 [Guyanagaster necrorhizus MCA 3950]